MNNSSYDVCTTGTNRKAQKIEVYFQDHITNHKKFRISMFPWMRIDQIKKDLANNKYAKNISWRDLRFFHKNIELKNNNKRLFDYNIEPSATIIITAHATIADIQLGIINPYQIFNQTPQQITNLLLNVRSGLAARQIPKLAPQGTSGTYFLDNHLKKKVAIFKPFDEEPYAPNNPRNYVGKLGDVGIRKGILSGQCATRQVAAYLLDIYKFHGVPATTYVEFYHPIFSYRQFIENDPIISTKQNYLKSLNTKHGSLQEFVQSHDVAGNISSKLFDVQEVHRIAILDIRILNCDRNQANILVRKMAIIDKENDKSIKSKFLKLIPIDHGLSFPDNLQIYDYQLVWMNYPQVSRPFSQKSLNFIDKIDPAEDSAKLRQKLGFRQICVRNFRIAETFLKKCAKAGFNLQQIGKMMYRLDDDDDDEDSQKEDQKSKSSKKNKELSQLQKLVNQAQNIYLLVKQNGIKSTIEFQIGLIKPRQPKQLKQGKQMKQFSLKPIMQQKQQQAKQLTSPRGLKKVRFQQPSIEKKASILQRNQGQSTIGQRQRNVSLPHLKKTSASNQKIKMKKGRKKQGPNGMHKAGRNTQKWEQIFYHYFEDLLDRFIAQKLKPKKKNISPTRGRLMSQDLEI